MELSSQLGRLEVGAAAAVSAETSHLLKLHVAAIWHVDWRERADFPTIKINYQMSRRVELLYMEMRQSTGGHKHQNDNAITDYDIKYGASTCGTFYKFRWQQLPAEQAFLHFPPPGWSTVWTGVCQAVIFKHFCHILGVSFAFNAIMRVLSLG